MDILEELIFFLFYFLEDACNFCLAQSMVHGFHLGFSLLNFSEDETQIAISDSDL